MTDVAMLDTNMDDGNGGMNDAAVGLLTGYPPNEVRRWMNQGGMPAEAVRNGRRRAKEAMAATGRELDGISALVFFAMRDNVDFQLDGEWLVRGGCYVGPA